MNCLESDTFRKQRSVAFWRMRRMSTRIVRVSWAEVSPGLLELLGVARPGGAQPAVLEKTRTKLGVV